jgi:hypothetical protein
MYGEGTVFTTNAQGFRGRENVDRAVPAGRYRVIALGDSFTMGYGVDDESSYAARMRAFCPALQTVNMGQGGYGVDQDYLWYKRDGAKLDAQVLLFAVIAQDFYRMAGDTFIGYPKPVLRARDGGLAIENVPVPRAWESRTALRRARTFVESLAVVRAGQWIAGKFGEQGAERKAEQFYGTSARRSPPRSSPSTTWRRSRRRADSIVLVYLPVFRAARAEPRGRGSMLRARKRRALQNHGRLRGLRLPRSAHVPPRLPLLG